MKIIIFTFGSRGDVQPFLALAVGLQNAGHRVTLVASHTHTEWIQSYGVTAQPTAFDLDEFFRRPESQAIIKSGNMLRQMRALSSQMSAGLLQALDVFWQAAQEAEFVIQTIGGVGGVEVAQQRGIPLAFAFLQPFAPTRAFPTFFLPFRSGPGWFNHFTHQLTLNAFGGTYNGPLNQWRRRRLDLPKWRSYSEMLYSRQTLGTPWLFAYSHHLLPKPPDWGNQHHVIGYWFLDANPNWQPPVELLRFLESGPPPVYIGFGSVGDGHAERRAHTIFRALEHCGQRAVIMPGWGGVAQMPAPDSVFFLTQAPHAWLFPRMASVIHHGGAGTTAAGLRAGIPQIITPFAIDQYAWADSVVKLGVGPKTTDAHHLAPQKLAEAIHITMNDTAMRARSAALGEKIRAENGVARAIEIIERHAAEFGQGARAARPVAAATDGQF